MQHLWCSEKSLCYVFWGLGPKKHNTDLAKNFILSLGHNTQKKMPHLTLEQRYEIQSYTKAGRGICEIAKLMGSNKSTISREIKRNSDQRNGHYKADLAQKKAKNRHFAKPKHFKFTEEVHSNVVYYLEQNLSPEQIVGRAKLEGKAMVSHESIYQFIWQDKRQKGTLYKHLRSKGKRYRKRGSLKDSRGVIADRKDISTRPAVVDAKERLGDLEIDLVIGSNHKGALVTINDRASGFLFMKKIEGKQASMVEEATIELLQDFKFVLHTLTSDNGKEFSNHKAIAQKLEIEYYFAHPYHSWERGANENLNGLIRQYFPKNYNFDLITEQQVEHAVNQLNNRPRKRFGFKTPNEIFTEKVKNMQGVAFMT
jgi:transposase, IS30 family